MSTEPTPIEKVSALVDELDCHQIPCWEITDVTGESCRVYVRRDRGDEDRQIADVFEKVFQWLLDKPKTDCKTEFSIKAVQLHPQEWEDMDTKQEDEE